ncbi:MAG: hypothetical protein M3367_00425 [Acidobacteriota bacterium]|nr:hypothetical protein [Acidobacteriota bacterium]
MKDSGFKPETEDGKQHNVEERDYLTATATAFTSEDNESAIIAFLIKEKISKHKLFAVKTDYLGQAYIIAKIFKNSFAFTKSTTCSICYDFCS